MDISSMSYSFGGNRVTYDVGSHHANLRQEKEYLTRDDLYNPRTEEKDCLVISCPSLIRVRKKNRWSKVSC